MCPRGWASHCLRWPPRPLSAPHGPRRTWPPGEGQKGVMPFLRWGFCTLTHQLLNLDMDPSPPPYALCSDTHIPPLPHFIHIRIPALSAQTLTALPPPSAGLTPSGSPAETPQQAPPDTDCHFLLLVTQTLSPRGSSFRGHRSHPPPSALWAGRRGDASRHLDADAAFHPITRTLTDLHPLHPKSGPRLL